MATFLPGTFLTVAEAGEVQSGVLNSLESHSNYPSVIKNYEEHQAWWKNTVSVLKGSFSIVTETGYALLYSAYKGNDDFKAYTFLFTSCPASFKSFEIWALYQAAQESELEFLDDCATPNIETALTGIFLKNLKIYSNLVQSKYKKYLSIAGSELNVKKLELQVQNRERDTGGDFALLFEWKDVRNELKICPIIFQAKRVADLDADIGQRNKNTGLQFDLLSRSKANPVYIFYNCNTVGLTENPRLPTVKKAKDISISGNAYKTSSVEGVVSFSVFLLDVMSSTSFFSTDSRTVALKEILAGIDDMELSNIVTFSVDPAALLEYQNEYQEILSGANYYQGYDRDDGPEM